MKDLYIAAHDEMVEEWMEAHPDATEEQAYEATADGAWERMANHLADIADYERKARREAE